MVNVSAALLFGGDFIQPFDRFWPEAPVEFLQIQRSDIHSLGDPSPNIPFGGSRPKPEVREAIECFSPERRNDLASRDESIYGRSLQVPDLLPDQPLGG